MSQHVILSPQPDQPTTPQTSIPSATSDSLITLLKQLFAQQKAEMASLFESHPTWFGSTQAQRNPLAKRLYWEKRHIRDTSVYFFQRYGHLPYWQGYGTQPTIHPNPKGHSSFMISARFPPTVHLNQQISHHMTPTWAVQIISHLQEATVMQQSTHSQILPELHDSMLSHSPAAWLPVGGLPRPFCFWPGQWRRLLWGWSFSSVGIWFSLFFCGFIGLPISFHTTPASTYGQSYTLSNAGICGLPRPRYVTRWWW